VSQSIRENPRYRVKCGNDGAVTFVSHEDAHAYWNDLATPSRYYSFLPCRECGRHLVAKSVTGKCGTRRCGSWCTEGYGLTCTCECGGANHGADLSFAPGELWCLR
jgi:hypothetical protein